MISFVSGEADHALSHPSQGTENSEPAKAAKAVWSESDKT